MSNKFKVLVYKDKGNKKGLINNFTVQAKDLAHAHDIAYISTFNIKEDFSLEVTPIEREK